jgi:hypothetical protein
MRAILIDPKKTPAISDIKIKGDLAGIQNLIGGSVEAIGIGKDDVLFVDEDWNVKEASKRHKGSFLVGKTKFGGRGLILGPKGEKSTKLKLLEASQLVTILP